MNPSPPDPPGHSSENSERFRWSGLFQQSSDPIFLLNRRRRVLFVNRAWEQLTGLTLADVKGQVCRRRPRGIVAEKIELVLGAMAPPPEVQQGRIGQARRHPGGPGAPAPCWHIDFLPLAGAEGSPAILGKIRLLPQSIIPTAQPLPEKVLALKDRRGRAFHLDQLVSDVPAMTRLREQIRLAAHCRVPVLLAGAPGTGKHWAARAIHETSPLQQQFFARLDCRRLGSEAVAPILFPADPRRLAFQGTLYLEEPQFLAGELQARLSERLDQKTDAHFPRIIAGFPDDPSAHVASGRLLQELHCRLSTLVMWLPPLRDRMQDLPWWCERLLERAARIAGKPAMQVTPEASEVLRAHVWPENLAELHEVLAGACLRAKGDRIEASDLPFYLRHAPLPPDKPLPLDAILEQVERRLIVQALKLARNNKTRAAELLAIWRPRLLRRMENLKIEDQ